MKHRKLRGYVLPTLYVVILVFIFGAVSLISSLLLNKDDYLYTTEVLKEEEDVPVVNTNVEETKQIVMPYIGDNVNLEKKYYDIKADEKTQENALIYFENTYMKNTGVLYTSDNTFDTIAVLDGTILNIKEDDILGKVVEVEHNTNLRTIYYGLSEISKSVGDKVNGGDVIGKSGTNKISDKNSLLFEVYYNGTLLNPEEFYNMDVSTLK